MTPFAIYLLVTGLISFTLFGIDKYKATAKKRRISEKALILSVAIGGRIGGVFGMQFFHHKTRKSSFQWKFRGCVAIRLVITMISMFMGGI